MRYVWVQYVDAAVQVRGTSRAASGASALLVLGARVRCCVYRAGSCALLLGTLTVYSIQGPDGDRVLTHEPRRERARDRASTESRACALRYEWIARHTLSSLPCPIALLPFFGVISAPELHLYTRGSEVGDRCRPSL